MCLCCACVGGLCPSRESRLERVFPPSIKHTNIYISMMASRQGTEFASKRLEKGLVASAKLHSSKSRSIYFGSRPIPFIRYTSSRMNAALVVELKLTWIRGKYGYLGSSTRMLEACNRLETRDWGVWHVTPPPRKQWSPKTTPFCAKFDENSLCCLISRNKEISILG